MLRGAPHQAGCLQAALIQALGVLASKAQGNAGAASILEDCISNERASVERLTALTVARDSWLGAWQKVC